MENSTERTISLNDLFKAFIKHWYIIAITVLIGVVVAYVMAFQLITPKYRATTETIVRGKPSVTEEYTIREAITYVDTIEAFFKSDAVLEQVYANINDQGEVITLGQISSGLTTSKSAQSVILKLSFIHEDKDLAVRVVNEVFNTAYQLANSSTESADNEYDFFEGTFIILTSAKKGFYHSPNKILYLMVGFLLGGIVGAGIILIIDLSRNTYRSKQEVEHELEIEVIGVIPEYEVNKHV